MTATLRLTFVLLLVAASTFADDAKSLPRSSPEKQGISSIALLGFIEKADSKLDSLHSFMLIRHGQVVAEGWWTPYNPQSRHELYSLSKSFTSTAVGIAIGEGKLTIDDSVLDTFKDDSPSEVSNNLKAMRLRDLLRMSAGHQKTVSSAADVITPKAFLANPVPFKPGTHFLYNTSATFMASAMLQMATGQTTLEYLKPRLFEPLGIVDPIWDTNSQGVSLGGYGLNLRTEDIAKFGQLYLQKGNWKGKQLIPASWVVDATTLQTSNGSNPKSDWDQGYGYQFWRSRHNSYRGDGAFGQYCIVLPEQDTVIAITSGVGDMQAVLNLVWDEILPGIHTTALPENTEVQGKLDSKLKSLTIRKPSGAATSPTLKDVAGKLYKFPENSQKIETLTIESGGNSKDVILVTKVDGKEQRIACSGAEWKRGELSIPLTTRKNVASSAAWEDEKTLVIKVVLYETPHIITRRLQFTGDEVSYSSEMNAGGKEKPVVGRRK